MPTLKWSILSFLILFQLSKEVTVYIDNTAQADGADGSKLHPFPSFAEAYQQNLSKSLSQTSVSIPLPKQMSPIPFHYQYRMDHLILL